MSYIIVALIAFLFSYLSSPLTIKLARRFSLVDLPKSPHPAALHKKTLPRAGGIAPLLGFLAALTIFALWSPAFFFSKAVWGIVISAALLVALGTADDKYNLNPYLRLAANFAIVGIVVAAGVGINSFTNPLGGVFFLNQTIYHISLPAIFGPLAGAHSIVLWADLFAFLWIIWVMNALNWSSGVDGQLPGIASIALLLLGIVASALVSKDPGQFFVAVLAFAAAGAFLGFLPFSFYPQKIMPGYGGSTLAGFLIATLGILSGAKLAVVSLVILIPLIDSLWAILRRVLGKHSPVWGDSFHLHHQLLRMGWSIPQICYFYYFVTAVFGLLALQLDSQEKFFALAILGVIIFSALFTIFILVGKFDLKKYG
ncbi:MAG TPA: MraY family glycosyltransferase [Candidatus Saccharimonadales bacterium]|nr:MraY family glycosyltransferase [Candidatus Saccharimonadales bacterium]